jgi:crossover junction endodeoxyribonuclease RuvC
LERLKPDVAVVEDIFYAVNPKSALKLGHVRGTIILSAINSGLKVVELTPREIKSGVTGYGQADKNQVAEMVRIILNLQQKPEPEDAADALAAAIAYAMRSDFENKIAVYNDE